MQIFLTIESSLCSMLILQNPRITYKLTSHSCCSLRFKSQLKAVGRYMSDSGIHGNMQLIPQPQCSFDSEVQIRLWNYNGFQTTCVSFGRKVSRTADVETSCLSLLSLPLQAATVEEQEHAKAESGHIEHQHENHRHLHPHKHVHSTSPSSNSTISMTRGSLGTVVNLPAPSRSSPTTVSCPGPSRHNLMVGRL